ncbi:MAG: hypothetical protein FWF95_07820 [Syntrophorhabdaceae bacterium]|nr:hypothetical protein [Syntrophorhabdaceae bacterium]
MCNIDQLNENEMKHLEFIQNAITRMGMNSFQMKGWAITIYSALLALFATNSDKNGLYMFVAIIPAIIFWHLDAYYLQQERIFMGIYNDAAKITPLERRQEVKLFEMPLGKYIGSTYSYWNVVGSKTIWPIYVFMIAGALLVGSLFFSSPLKKPSAAPNTVFCESCGFPKVP